MLDNFSFGIRWSDIHTDSYESFAPRMTNYHTHSYYEITLITSGKAHILISDTAFTSECAQLVLIKPYVPHYIYTEPGVYYSRNNVCFSVDFLSEEELQWQGLTQIFNSNAVVLELTKDACEQYKALYSGIHKEEKLERKKLLLLYYLSLLADADPNSGNTTNLPGYVTSTMAYVSTHYAEHLTTDILAARCGISRVTLMNAFKKHAGAALSEYILQCRLKHAIEMLRQGIAESQVAEACGFSETSSMIRCFRRRFGLPPRKYIASLSENHYHT